MAKIEFTAKLELMGGRIGNGSMGRWMMVVMPKSASAKLGSRARVPVVGTVNGFPIRTSAFPLGDGTHHIQINRTMREGAGGLDAGDRVKVSIEVDTKPRIVALPPALKEALANSSRATAAFEKLAPSHKKEIADWIASAKKPETVERRVDKAMQALRTGTSKPR